MLLAVLSDIHANLSALNAVVQDLKASGAQKVLVLGDLVGYLTRPNEVVQFVRTAGWECVVGNYDLAVLTGPEHGPARYLAPGLSEQALEVFRWSCQATGAQARRYLSGLAQRRKIEIAGRRILMVHASPAGIRDYVYPDTPDEKLSRWLNEEEVEVLLLGHTHIPFVRKLPKGLVVNPGSVGKSKDADPRASYALVELTPSGLYATIRRVAYDIDAEAALLKAAGFPQERITALYEGT